VSQISIVGAALNGKTVGGTEVLTRELLQNEDERLAEQAFIELQETPRAKPTAKKEETSGIVLMAASPIWGADGTLLGVLYGGHLVNRNFMIVDRVWDLLYKDETYRDQDIGTVTIFLEDLRISTNVKTKTRERAIGTRVSTEVADAILTREENGAVERL